jgi:multiple sugar transport system permease protein
MAIQSTQEPRAEVLGLPAQQASLWQSLQRRMRGVEVVGPLFKRRERWFYLMISPWLVGFVVFMAGPLISAVGLSFAHFNLTTGATWAGIENYVTMTRDPLFFKTLGNTAYYTFVSVPLGLIVAFALALLLNQKLPAVNIFRTIFFLPSVVSGVAVLLLWSWIFNPKYGLINGFLAEIGVDGPGWLQSQEWSMPALIIISLWGIGWMMLVFLAGLQDIPPELSEAAEIDGATAWQKLWHVTIPMISPVTFFLFVTGLIFAMQVFIPAYILTKGGPNNSTMTLSLLIYLAAFQWDKMGYATAAAVVLIVITLVITLVQFRVGDLWVHYETKA